MEIDKDVLFSRVLDFLGLETSDVNGFFHLTTKESNDWLVFGRNHERRFYLYKDVDDFLEKLKLISAFISTGYTNNVLASDPSKQPLKNPFKGKSLEEICIVLDLAEDDLSLLDSSHAPCPKD